MTISFDLPALKEQDKRHHLHACAVPATCAKEGGEMIVRAEGLYLYTDSGHKVLDASAGLSNVNVAYGHPRICQAAFEAMQQLSFSHTIGGRTNPWVAALSEKLAAITPDSFQHFFYANSGSDANESAIKMAWQYWHLRDKPGKRGIIARDDSYHGNTIFATGLTSAEFHHKPFGGMHHPLIHHIGASDSIELGEGMTERDCGLKAAGLLEAKILELGADKVAAFIAEPIVMAGRHIFPQDSYWPEVRRICDQYDVLLIADEVINGFGKTGRWFGFEHYGFEPDLFTMAKGMASGYFPISAVAVGEKVREVLFKSEQAFAHLFTNCGHPVGAAVALENIAVIEEEGLIEKVSSDIGPYFARGLAELEGHPLVAGVNALGVLGMIKLQTGQLSTEDANALPGRLYDALWSKGLLVRGMAPVLPMTISREQIDTVIAGYQESLSELAATMAYQV